MVLPGERVAHDKGEAQVKLSQEAIDNEKGYDLLSAVSAFRMPTR